MPNHSRYVTDPSYISEQMFAKVLMEQFFENTDDPAVRKQAITLITPLRSSGSLPQIIADVFKIVFCARVPHGWWSLLPAGPDIYLLSQLWHKAKC